MQPFYFGSSQRQLFGVYHAAEAGGPPRPSAVLLCYPLGHEYLRAHRAFRNLAAALAAQGFHVLRFDYFGSGDSGGDGEATTVDQCLEDIATSIDELKDISGCARVSLIGLRFGATLASLAAASRADVDRVVLWDPVLDGSVYLDELLRVQQLWRTDRLGDEGATSARGTELLGFPMSGAGLARLCATRLLPIEANAARPVSLLVSEELPAYAPLRQALDAAHVAGAYQVVEGSGNWTRGDLVHHTLLPHGIIRAISTVMCS